MGWKDYLRRLDYVLLGATAGLIAYGITMVYLATRGDIEGAPLYYVRQQLIAVVIGVVVGGVVVALDYEIYRRFKWWFYGAAVALLLAVIPFGQVVNGARRWIDLGVTRFQPSGAALLLLTLAMGAFLADRVEIVGAKRVTLIALGLILVPAYIVYKEPDFGSAMVLVMLTLAMLYFYGAPWWHFVSITVVGSAVIGLALLFARITGKGIIHDYQIKRLLVFIDPSRDPTSAGYNIIQSKIAVGAGALLGRGDGATQAALHFLPEHHTDFIFAVISERQGFLGATVLLLLYAVLIWRALRIAAISRDMFGSILAGGIGVVLLFQVFVNVGMTIGIMPVTGIPLPFVSYGGTHMIAFLVLVGLLQAVHVRAAISTSERGFLGK